MSFSKISSAAKRFIVPRGSLNLLRLTSTSRPSFLRFHSTTTGGNDGSKNNQGSLTDPSGFDPKMELDVKPPLVFSSQKRSQFMKNFDRGFLFFVHSVIEPYFLQILAGVAVVGGLALYGIYYYTDLLVYENFQYPREVDEEWYRGYGALHKGQLVEALENFHNAIVKCQEIKGKMLSTVLLMFRRGEALEKHGYIDHAKEAYWRLVDYIKDCPKPELKIYLFDSLNRLIALENDVGRKESLYRQLMNILLSTDFRNFERAEKTNLGQVQFVRRRSEELLADTILNYGNFLVEQNLYEEAIFLITEGMAITQDRDRRVSRMAALYDLAGWCNFSLGKVNEALQWGNKAIVHSNRFFHPKRDLFLYHQGLYLAKLGSVDKAVECWKQGAEFADPGPLKEEMLKLIGTGGTTSQ